MSVTELQVSLHDKLVKDLKRLNVGVNKTQFTAQRFEEDMVLLVKDMALSIEASMDHRLRCAVQVVQWARGSVETWRHDREDITADQPTLLGGTVGETVDAARETAELFGRLDYLVRQKIPFRDWPKDIQAMAEAQAFADVDEDATLVGIAPPSAS